MVLLAGEQKVKNHLGNTTVRLRPLRLLDRDRVCRWMSDPYVIQHSFVVPGPSSLPSDFFTLAYAARYFDLLFTDASRRTYAILYNAKHIGNVGLKDIDQSRGHAECFIEIGEKSLRGRGIGQTAMAHLLNIGFGKLGLLTIELEVLEFNVAAIQIYQKLGFRKLASSSWHYDEFGMYWRVLRMGLERAAC